MILASLTLIPVWGDFQLCHSSRLTPAGSYSIVSLPAVLRSLRATWPELELSYHACAVALLQYSSDGRPAATPPFIYTDANGEERNIQFDQLPQIDSFDALHCWFGDRRPSVTSTFIKWTAIQRSLGKPVPKCQTILHFAAATDFRGPKTCKTPRSPECRHKCGLRGLSYYYRGVSRNMTYGAWSGGVSSPPLSLEVGPLNAARRSGGTVLGSPAGSGAEPQPKLNLVHFSLKIWHLVATILMIFPRVRITLLTGNLH